MSRHTVRLTQTGRLCLIGHSEGVPPDLCCHTNYQSASARTLHWHRGIAGVRGRARARPLRLCALSVAANRHFFFLCGHGGCGSLGPDLLAARARAALCYQADGSGPTLQPRPPRCSRWRRAVQVRCRCATRPRRSALVDSGACSIRSGARMQLGMRKGDHDMVHGLACMRGCSLVVQRGLAHVCAGAAWLCSVQNAGQTSKIESSKNNQASACMRRAEHWRQ